MLDTQQLNELRQYFRTDIVYRAFLSEKTQQVIDEIIDHPRFPGTSDPSALAMLAALLHIVQPRSVLQLGTYIGFSAVIIGDILAHNSRPGRVLTVEPDKSNHDLARMWARQAGLAEVIEFFDGYSTDPALDDVLQVAGPVDMIYLDTSHAYGPTIQELDRVFEHGWLVDHGLLILHDASQYATRWDSTGQGGVRRALDEWTAARGSTYQLMIFEPPLWPNQCGLGFLQRRQSGPTKGLAALDDRVADLERMIAAKNEHIEYLESLISRIQSGRALRLLRRLGW